MNRTCRRCGQTYPETAEFFRAAPTCRGGLSWTCRPCYRSTQDRWRRANRERHLATKRRWYAERYAGRQAERERDRQAALPMLSRARIMREGMRDRAARKGVEWDADLFTIQTLYLMLQAQPACPICGKMLDCGFKPRGCGNDASPSCDRIDPRRGYVSGNVAIICWRCNRIKCDALPEDLERIADWMRHATSSFDG